MKQIRRETMNKGELSVTQEHLWMDFDNLLSSDITSIATLLLKTRSRLPGRHGKTRVCKAIVITDPQEN